MEMIYVVTAKVGEVNNASHRAFRNSTDAEVYVRDYLVERKERHGGHLQFYSNGGILVGGNLNYSLVIYKTTLYDFAENPMASCKKHHVMLQQTK